MGRKVTLVICDEDQKDGDGRTEAAHAIVHSGKQASICEDGRCIVGIRNGGGKA